MMESIVLVLLIAFSAFFTGAEVTYASVNRVRLRKMAEEGSRSAALAVRIGDRFEYMSTALLLGNSVVNVAAAVLTATFAYRLSGGKTVAVVLAVAVIMFLVLLFGEILPRVIFKRYAERTALILAYPLAFFNILFLPVTFIVSKLLTLLSGIWGKSDDSVTEEDLATLIETAEEDGGIDEEKSDLLQSALAFSDITLDEIFTHRKDVLALDIDETSEENLRLVNSSRYSRLPVYKDSIDNIVGILNINQFYKQVAIDRSVTVKDVMLEPTFMHSAVKLPAALAEMRDRQIQMVVVLDEYGGTLGIVTMEDILEQIVGDIWDESDEIVVELTQSEDGAYKVLGEMNVYDMFDELDIDDRDFESDCNTVSGWSVEMLGQNPEVGMCFDYKNLHIEIIAVDDVCVEEVRVTVNELPSEDEE